MLPRYFVAAGAPEPVPPLPVAHVLALMEAEGRDRLALVEDLAGAIRPIPADAGSLPATLMEQVLRHELAGVPVRLPVRSMWWMAVEALEQPADPPGFNDPIYLYGRLYGPLEGAANYSGAMSEAPVGVQAHRGQLTLTRGDLLSGFLCGQRQGFETGEGACLHAILPGGTVEETAAREGMILAIPMLPVELRAADPSMSRANGGLWVELLCELLAGLQADLLAYKQGTLAGSAFAKRLLPVADRAALIAAWEADGFLLSGQVATRKVRGAGLLSAIASAMMSPEVRQVPPQATLEALVPLCEEALSLLPGWPDARAAHMAAHMAALRAAPRAGLPPLRLPANTIGETPRAPAADEGVPAGAAVVAPAPIFTQQRARQPAWMEDFIAQHEDATHRSRLTPLRPAHRPAQPPAETRQRGPVPDWMKDFE